MITYLPVGRFRFTGHRSQVTGRVMVMKVLVAGATGAVGGALVPALVRAGHEVVGTTRTPAKSEEDPLDPNVGKEARETLAAIRRLEETVTGAGGLALRYGGFYGPGTSLARGGEVAEMIRKRKFPIAGSGAGIWSFTHVDD